MNQQDYKVLITTSGTGSRLGELTRNTNKALVNIAGKPAITYIIDQYPEEIELVITIGYLGNQVQAALLDLYPNRKITFVPVDLYEGPGSSLGYSMLQAESSLQCPFIFHACDTLVFGNTIQEPSKNWMGTYVIEGDRSQYRTIQMEGDQALRINEKKEGDSAYAFIGIFGVVDYQAYWHILRSLYEKDPEDQNLNDTMPLSAMLQKNYQFEVEVFPVWLDTGNPEALARTEQYLHERNS